MNLPIEKQVCSLEYAQKLKSLGVPQESLFYWFNTPFDDIWECMHRKEIRNGDLPPLVNRDDCISAFTCSELGEMLPVLSCVTWKNYQGHACREDSLQNGNDIYFEATTEADCRAKMLVFLLENKLITLE